MADFLSRSVSSDSFRHCEDDDHLTQFCAVEEKNINSLVSIYHNDGHFSVTKVRKALLAAGHWFPKMRGVLYEYQKNCVICARAKSYSNNNIPEGSLPSFPQVEPRQMVFVDVVGRWTITDLSIWLSLHLYND